MGSRALADEASIHSFPPRKEHLQILGRHVLHSSTRGAVAEKSCRERAFLLLEIGHPLLDGVGRDEAIREDGALLSDPMGAVDGFKNSKSDQSSPR